MRWRRGRCDRRRRRLGDLAGSVEVANRLADGALRGVGQMARGVGVVGARPHRCVEADGDVTVLTKIIGDKDGKRQDLAKVDYRLRKRGEWRVIDVTVEGVSLVANFRSQFQSIMANGGINRLLSLLHEKNAAGEGAQIK